MARIAILTGAGVSTASGIPDFRGPSGVWTLTPERARLLDIDAFLGDPAIRRAGWQDWRDHPAWSAAAGPAHLALTRLVAAGAADAILTQNFDGLHQAAGTPPDAVVELHGTLRSASCVTCGAPHDTKALVAQLDAAPDPHCEACGGIVKPDIVYFGEPLPAAAMDRAVREASTCEVFLAVGTTLSVYPVASLAGIAVQEGADLVIVNAEPTDYDRYAERIVREPIETALPALVSELLGTPSRAERPPR